MQGIDEQSAKTYVDRNSEMYELYKNGVTLEAIGEKFGITKQRVHQIIRRCKIGEGDYYEAQKLESEQKLLDPTGFNDWLKEKGVKTIKK